MGIFNKHDKQSASSAETTIVANGTKIEGTLNCSTRIHIDGVVQGEIISKSIVTIGKKGKFYGTIKAKELILNGFIEGIADCDSVELLMGCIFKGKVISKELMVEAKATFDGESMIRKDKKTTKKEK